VSYKSDKNITLSLKAKLSGAVDMHFYFGLVLLILIKIMRFFILKCTSIILPQNLIQQDFENNHFFLFQLSLIIFNIKYPKPSKEFRELAKTITPVLVSGTKAIYA
jgi:hypothetical protein